MHTFPDEGTLPHYEMAIDADDDTASAVMLDKKNSGVMAKPEQATELCLGPERCQTGKSGLVKSSSSFQVSFSFKPTVLAVDGKVKLRNKPQDVIEEADEEWDPDDTDSDDSSDDFTYTSDSTESDSD